MLMKLHRLNVEQYTNYFSKFELKIHVYVDFIADLTHVQYVLSMRNGTLQFGLRFACALPFWPERVLAFVVSLSCISSVCAKLLLVESWFPDLFFVVISLGFARFYEHV